MSDPVADKSTFLCMYMSNHPDTLVAYVRYWGKVSDAVESAKMTAIDSKGMTLSYKTKGEDAKREVRVTFDPPLAGYEEVKPRLMTMTAVAQEELGMASAPQLSTFRVTNLRRVFEVVVPMLGLIYTTFAPGPSSSPWDAFFAPAQALRGHMRPRVLPIIWATMLAIHAAEALYTFSLCRKHRTGLIVGAQYVLATFCIGFPVWTDMRRQIQNARIDSIMKGQ